MIDTNLIKENPNNIKKALKRRGFDIDIEKIIKLDDDNKAVQSKIEKIQSDKNTASKQIVKADKAKKKKIIEQMKVKDIKQKALVTKQIKIELELNSLLSAIPNIPKDDVPTGKDDSENKVIKKAKIPKFKFEVVDYMTIAEKMNAIDIKRASKVSGARFGYIKNNAALLQLALINYTIDLLTKSGFQFIIPPVLIKTEQMAGMGYLEHGGNQEIYHMKDDDLVLVGTSEQAIGPMHSDEIFDEIELPKRYIAYSPCFRREAGSYGKDTKGLFRVHQFDKLEMFSYTTPDKSEKEQQFLVSLQKKLMKGLNLPYQLVQLCTGDMGIPSARTIDIEAYIPSQKRFRETHSCSTCTDYQARRLKIRYKNTKTGNNELVHTLNGTAFAMGRIIIAIMENHQKKDGTFSIPKTLEKYLPNRT